MDKVNNVNNFVKDFKYGKIVVKCETKQDEEEFIQLLRDEGLREKLWYIDSGMYNFKPDLCFAYDYMFGMFNVFCREEEWFKDIKYFGEIITWQELKKLIKGGR